NPEAILRWKKQFSRTEVEAISLQVEPGIMVPLLLVRPRTQPGPPPIVIAVSEGGKERFLVHQSREIESLLQGGVAVCLADVNGTAWRFAGSACASLCRQPACTGGAPWTSQLLFNSGRSICLYPC